MQTAVTHQEFQFIETFFYVIFYIMPQKEKFFMVFFMSFPHIRRVFIASNDIKEVSLGSRDYIKEVFLL